MAGILADILSLIQYSELFKDKSRDHRLDRCLCCGKARPQLHGCYPRKADRSGASDESLNPIWIQRYYCPACQRTCSVLPECLPPLRWHLWAIQQAALVLLLAGKSLRAIAQEISPSRRTIGRWMNRFKEQFRLHKDVLCHHVTDLGRTTGFTDFWQACLGQISLAQAMRLCHVAGATIP
jgi:transposase-like protein